MQVKNYTKFICCFKRLVIIAINYRSLYISSGFWVAGSYGSMAKVLVIFRQILKLSLQNIRENVSSLIVSIN